MSKDIVGALPPYNDAEEIEDALRSIAAREDTIYAQILNIVNFFNSIYVTDGHLNGQGAVDYQVDINKLVSVTYNNSLIEIKYKGVNAEEKTIKFVVNVPNPVEVNGSVIQLVKCKYTDNVPDVVLPSFVIGDAIISSDNKLKIVKTIAPNLSYDTFDLKENVLYLRADGKRIYYYNNDTVDSFDIGGNSVEFEENFIYVYGNPSSYASSRKAVMAKDIYTALNDIWQTIMESESDPGTPDSFEEFDADGNSFSTFNHVKGNPGIFKIDKKPEDITVEDVDKAYSLKLFNSFTLSKFDLNKQIDELNSGYLININGSYVLKGPNDKDDDIEVQEWERIFGSLQTTKHLWTASEIELSLLDSSSTSSSHGSNGIKLQNAANNDSCIGIYLDDIYTINLKSFFPDSVSKPENYFEKAIVLNKDFIIAGNSNENSGISCVSDLFYTTHSICIYNIKIEKRPNTGGLYETIYINLENGIDQVQVINSKFVSVNPSEKGRYVFLYSPNTRPYKLFEDEVAEKPGDGSSSQTTFKIGGQNYTVIPQYHQTHKNDEGKTIREVADYNYLNHLYVTGCTFEGDSDVEGYGGIRFVKSARFTNNKFINIKGAGIYIGCPNLEEDNPFTRNAVSYGKHIPLSDVEGKNDRLWLEPYCYEYNTPEVKSNRKTVDYLYMVCAKIYMACPIYVAGNEFSGAYISGETGENAKYNGYPKICVNKTHGGQYMCAMISETSISYFLHNKVLDFISAVYSHKSPTKIYYKSNGVKITDLALIDNDEYAHHKETDSGGNITGVYRNRYDTVDFTTETYDTYESCNKVYNVNNYVRNICKFVKASYDENNCGICKSKNTNINFARGGLPYLDLVRYYKRNHYILDTDTIKKSWEYYLPTTNNSITITDTDNTGRDVTETITDNEEYLYNSLVNEKEVDFDGKIPLDSKVLSIALCASTLCEKSGISTRIYPTKKYVKNSSTTLPCTQVLKEFVFDDNVVDAGKGHIHGIGRNLQTPTNFVSFENNKFIASRFCGSKWDDRNVYKTLYNISYTNQPASYIFPIRLYSIPKYGNSVVKINNNLFKSTSNEPVDDGGSLRFLSISYYKEETHYEDTGRTTKTVTAKEGDVSLIDNNIFDGPSTIGVYIASIDIVDNNTITDLYFNKNNKEVNNNIIGLEEPEFPEIGSKIYKIDEDGKTYIYKAIQAGTYAAISFRIQTLLNTTTYITLSKLLLPLLPNETIGIVDKTSRILEEVKAQIDSYTVESSLDSFANCIYGIDNQTYSAIESLDDKKSFLKREIEELNEISILCNTAVRVGQVIRLILLANDYVEGSSNISLAEELAAGSFVRLSSGGDLRIYIKPKHVGKAYKHFKDNISLCYNDEYPQLKHVLQFEGAYSTFVPVPTTATYYRSKEGTDTLWEKETSVLGFANDIMTKFNLYGSVEKEITVSASDPLSAVTGDLYFNSVNGKVYEYNGSTWQQTTKTYGIAGRLAMLEYAIDNLQ